MLFFLMIKLLIDIQQEGDKQPRLFVPRTNCEESPNTAGQGAGQHPGVARRWKVQQKIYRPARGKGEMARQELTAQTATFAAV
jgi:hypothetical protein